MIHNAVREIRGDPSKLKPNNLEDMIKLTADLANEIAWLERALVEERNSRIVEHVSILEEMRSELQEREATAARSVDRHTTLRDRQVARGTKEVANYDSAVRASNLIYENFNTIDPLNSSLSLGSKYLAGELHRDV